jgi:hypothetical protein
MKKAVQILGRRVPPPYHGTKQEFFDMMKKLQGKRDGGPGRSGARPSRV